MLDRATLAQRAEARRSDYEYWLRQLVEIPSVSVDPSYAADVRRCAEAACDLLRGLGGEADVLETDGHPLVHGRLSSHPEWPSVTVYNHLDVQPADGDAWRTDPFNLIVEGERYFGRGA